MKKPKVIIYDNDGMILNGGRFSDQYAKEFGMDLAVMTPFFEGPFKKCLVGEADLKYELTQVLEAWKWKGTADELLEYWFAVGETTYDEHIFDAISKLKAQGLIICLATNQEKYRMQHLIDTFSYGKAFDEIFFSANLCAHKTDTKGLEKIFQTLKEKYGLSDKGEVMYWDDHEENVADFNAAGFNGQLYQDFSPFKAVLADYGYQV
ncbi:MAG: HAD hydrolase-like protein [bacterium]